jgi:hypothetical protein
VSDQLPVVGSVVALEPARPRHSAIDILQAAVERGITAENVAVVKEIKDLVREEQAHAAKIEFNKAFFALQKNMPEIYADKSAKDREGRATFIYCSEEELSRALKPHLDAHGFAMLCGQEANENRITVKITLIHEAGHSEERSYSVRPGTPNAMKDAAMCDAGAATTAWRHLIIKMFSLKSRIQSEHDARNLGEKLNAEQVKILRDLVAETGSDEVAFLKFAGAASYDSIMSSRYSELYKSLAKRKAKQDADVQKRINESV